MKCAHEWKAFPFVVLLFIVSDRVNLLVFYLKYRKRVSVMTLRREHVSVPCFSSEVILAHRVRGPDGERLAVMLLQPLTSCCYNSSLTMRGKERMDISLEAFFIKSDSTVVACF